MWSVYFWLRPNGRAVCSVVKFFLPHRSCRPAFSHNSRSEWCSEFHVWENSFVSRIEPVPPMGRASRCHRFFAVERPTHRIPLYLSQPL